MVISTMCCEARSLMEKQATYNVSERKRLAKISLPEAFAIAIAVLG
ncbi:hypothetical protein [Nostoc sp.]